jgi:hypothetical protein
LKSGVGLNDKKTRITLLTESTEVSEIVHDMIREAAKDLGQGAQDGFELLLSSIGPAPPSGSPWNGPWSIDGPCYPEKDKLGYLPCGPDE